MPYLKVTCGQLNRERRVQVASALTDAVVDLFTPPPGPSPSEIRARTTVHFTSYGVDELFVGGRPATAEQPDVTVELSDWFMSTRQQARAATASTPLLCRLFGAESDAVNLRFHSYRPGDFAVGGVLLSERIPQGAQLAKRMLG